MTTMLYKISTFFSLKKCTISTTRIMAIRVIKFEAGDTKLEKKLTKNQRTERKLLNFENWINIMGRCQKEPKFDFQSQFSMSKINQFFFKKIFIWEYQFRRPFFVKTFFSRLNFWTTLLSKIRPNFCRPHSVNSQNTAISFDYCWFLSKNLAF